MTAILVGFLATVIAGLLGLHPPESGSPRPPSGERAQVARVALAVLTIVVSFCVQLAVLLHAARMQLPFPAWFASLPLIAIDDRAPLFGHSPAGPAAGICAIVETIGCAALYFAARRKGLGRASWILVACASAVMLAAAIATPAVTSFDMYAYVGSAHVSDPYRPPSAAFTGDFALINRIYGTPILPSPYGPVWLALARLATAPFGTLAAQLLALRVTGALALVACALALRRLDVRDADIALVALNPALIGFFVLDGHNDLAGVALVLWAIALQPRSNLAAAALAILAGGIKAPFLAIATQAFARAATLRTRLIGGVVVAAGGLAISALFGGSAYLSAIRTTSYLYRAEFFDHTDNALHFALACGALAAIALALLARRYWPAAAWSFLASAASTFGWYTVWGLPYAALERRWLGVFLVSLPLLSFLLATVYAMTQFGAVMRVVAVVGAPLVTYAVLRRRHDVATVPASAV